jgi:3-oxoacyl-[acyl-carrier protein] reductase
MALELAPRKINVNAVAPGAIDTPGAASTEKVKEQIIAAIPWKRQGQTSDIANAVHYLASDEADYVTGQILVVDGGWKIQ